MKEPKTYVYTRMASAMVADPKHSIKGQETACLDYANTHGLKVEAVYEDMIVSGNTLGPELEKLLNRVSQEPGCHLIVDDPSRIARDLSLSAEVLKRLDEANVTLHWTTKVH